MSGFEVAGIVLGAFPIALEALRQYEVVKSHIKRWRGIQDEYAECRDDICFQQLFYEDNLRDLLADAAVDEYIVDDLVSDPHSDYWRNASIMRLLGAPYYRPYVNCISSIERTMGQLNHELKADAKYVRDKLGNTPPSSKLTAIRFQLWRVSFSTGEKSRERKRLLEQLHAQNEKLQKLLQMSRNTAKRRRADLPAVDTTICNFWKQANHLFEALTGAWSCRTCQGHEARLLLQHRTKDETDFNIISPRAHPSTQRYVELGSPTASINPLRPSAALLVE